VVPDSPVDELLHDFVALRVELAFGIGLRDTTRQLSIAEVVIGHNLDLKGTICLRIRGVIPVDVNVPEVDAVVIEDLPELRAPSRHHDIRRSRSRQFLAIDVGVVQEIHAVNDNALFGGELARKHILAICNTGVLLNHVVARAGCHVIAIGPNCRPRVV
jgi:hypothetical protein